MEKGKKELPVPKYYVQIDRVIIENKEKGEKLVEFLRKHGLFARIKLETHMNCFECGEKDELGECNYGLHHEICPIGGLFNHRELVYQTLKRKLEEEGYDTSWLDKYYEEYDQLHSQ